jgi:cobalt-zinc-cadmium efflux system outer membrane protein
MKSKNLVILAIATMGLAVAALGQGSGTHGEHHPPAPCMAGMVMPGCAADGTRLSKQPQQAPGGSQLAKPQEAADAQVFTSIRASGESLQESLPMPELLRQVVSRPAMSLADFLKLGDANNPTLKQANEQVQRKQQLARQAALYPNPSIGYQGEQIRGGSYGGGEQGGFIQQTIVLGGKLGLRRDIYQQQRRSDAIAVDEQIYRVHGAIEQAFYDALTAQASVRIRRQLLGVALDAVQTVHQLANVGQADEPDMLQTEVEAEQAKVDYAHAQREYLQAFQVLAAIAGQPNIPVCPLEGDLEKTPDLNAEQMVEAIPASSPTIKRNKRSRLPKRA